MKKLHGIVFAAFSLLLGVSTAVVLHKTYPAPPTLALLAEREDLRNSILQQANALPLLAVHQQWKKLKNYIDIYQHLSLTAVDSEKRLGQDSAADGYFYWQGVLTGPVKDLVLASRALQTMAAVRFERLSVEQGQASLFLSVAGGPA